MSKQHADRDSHRRRQAVSARLSASRCEPLAHPRGHTAPAPAGRWTNCAGLVRGRPDRVPELQPLSPDQMGHRRLHRVRGPGGRALRDRLHHCRVRPDRYQFRYQPGARRADGHGTCWPARPPREISLLEIYRAVDAPEAFAIHAHTLVSDSDNALWNAFANRSLATLSLRAAERSSPKSLAGNIAVADACGFNAHPYLSWSRLRHRTSHKPASLEK
jgi:hypothetical protein